MTNPPALTIRVFLEQFRGMILLNIVLWALIPGILFGNLHVDTLEALYWARVPAFGYWKHPPITTWLLGIAAQPGDYSILLALLLSQALTVVTAYLTGRAATTLAGLRAGQLAVALFFVSSLASFYSLQINHNSVLAPFMAATLAFGIDYLEKRKLISIIGLGLAVGLGALTKYEIIFAVLPLFIIALAISRYRSVFGEARSYISLAIAALVIAPHLLWLHDHDWISIKRAADSAPLTDAQSVFEGFWGVLWGSVAIVLTPLLMLRFYKISLPNLGFFNLKRHDERFRIGWIILILSPLGLIFTGLITGQFVKALWLLPLAPAISIGAGIVLAHKISKRFDERHISLTLKGMVTLFALFWAYLFAGELVGHPHEAYFSQTKPLARQVEALWKRHQSKPLACVIINEVKIGGSPVLWLTDKPLFIEIPFRPWGTTDKQTLCNDEGAIVIDLDEGVPAKEYFPRLCDKSFEPIDVRSLMGRAPSIWPGHISYLPPRSETCAP